MRALRVELRGGSGRSDYPWRGLQRADDRLRLVAYNQDTEVSRLTQLGKRGVVERQAVASLSTVAV